MYKGEVKMLEQFIINSLIFLLILIIIIMIHYSGYKKGYDHCVKEFANEGSIRKIDHNYLIDQMHGKVKFRDQVIESLAKENKSLKERVDFKC